MAHSRIHGSLLQDSTISASKLDFTPGDMTKAVYDSNADGTVDAADVATAAPWAGITGKPSEFTSNEDIVAVDDSRFVNMNPTGSFLTHTLDAIDGQLLWEKADPVEISDNSFEDIVIGPLASTLCVVFCYHAVRNGDHEFGRLILFSDGVSNHESALLDQTNPSFSAAATAGLTFATQINGSNLELRVTSDASGDTTKLFSRWANFDYS